MDADVEDVVAKFVVDGHGFGVLVDLLLDVDEPEVVEGLPRCYSLTSSL